MAASMLAELISGAEGGMMGALASHPFDVCSVAVMRGEAPNFFAALVRRIRSEGVLGLWRGVPMNALFNIVNKSVYFLMYAIYTNLYKRLLQRSTVASAANIVIGWSAQMSAGPFFPPFHTVPPPPPPPHTHPPVPARACAARSPAQRGWGRQVFLRSLQPQFQGCSALCITRELVAEGGVARLYQGASSWSGRGWW
jgi:hypothetical protein